MKNDAVRILMAVMALFVSCLTVRAERNGLAAGDEESPAATTSKDLKVVVFTDPHVMAPELLVSEGEAWTNFLDADHKLVEYSRALFDEMVNKIKTEIQPDLVLITGDLTKDGEALSHHYVKGKLDELKRAGIPALVVTGNHDWGTGNARYYDGATSTPAETMTMSELATLYADYGFGSADREETTLTYACEPIPELVVIGIDSGRDGQLSSTTLQWVCDHAKAACNNGKQVLAMMHHPLIPHFTGAEFYMGSVSIQDYATVRNALADAGVRVIFTGHIHTSDMIRDYNGDLSKPIYDVTTGSLVSYPDDYRVVTFPSDLSSADITTYSITEITAGDGFADVAKKRFLTASEKIVQSRGAAYAAIASVAAEAFLYHAEGDEADNADAQTTLSLLINLGIIAQRFGFITEAQLTTLSNLANSMLKDLSNYGDIDREDRTADRTLSIPMPSLSSHIPLINDDSLPHRFSPSIYTLQGIPVTPPTQGIYINGRRKVMIK